MPGCRSAHLIRAAIVVGALLLVWQLITPGDVAAQFGVPPPVLVHTWGSFGSDNNQFNFPFGVAVGSNGDVYVADSFNNRIQQFHSDGTFVRVLGSSGSINGKFDNPTGVAVGSNGDVYVADANNNRIQQFHSDGTFVRVWDSSGSINGKLNNPTGVAVGSNGSVYVADTSNHRIQQFTGTGGFVRAWGSRGTGNGQFLGPSGVAVGSDGSVYVADTSNHRIQQFEDRPLISAILNQQVAEDFTLGPVQFTVGDPPFGTGADVVVTAASSDQSLLPNAGIVLGGSGANRTVTLTPTPNRIGSVTVTLTVTKGNKQATTSFVLTVGGVNDPPTISPILDQTARAGAPTAPIRFTIGDPETPPDQLTVRASSSDQSLVPDANLALGGSGAERTLTITPAAGRAGPVNITVTVSDGVLAASTASRLIVAAVDADLATSLVIVPDPAVVGGPLTYAVTVANLGPADAAGVTATISWPPLVRFGSAAPSQGTCTPSPGQVACALGSLPRGATATIAIATTGVTPGAVATTVRVTSATPDPNGANNAATASATVVAAPPGSPPPSANLGLSIADSPDPVAVGSPVQYTVTMTNAGPAAASGVTLVAGLPTTATVSSVEASQGSCAQSGGTLTCTLGGLANGARATARVVVVPSAIGVAALTASISGGEADPVLADNTAAQTTAVNGSVGPSSPPPPGLPPAGGSRCAPRPANQVAVVRDGPERLRVTIAAGTLPATPSNSLHEVRFGAAQNALIDIPGGPSGSPGGFAHRPSDEVSLTFFVRRASPSGAATVPLVLVNECGEYRTFVGGGPGAF